MGLPGLLAYGPTSRREHAIYNTLLVDSCRVVTGSIQAYLATFDSGLSEGHAVLRGTLIYEQDRPSYLKKRAADLALYGIGFVAAIGAVTLMIPWLASNPSLPRSYWLLPIIVIMIVFQMILWAGPDFSSRRFAVYGDGFSPPYRGMTFSRSRFGPFVKYADVKDIRASTYTRQGVQGVYSVSIELNDGRRVVFRTQDVGDDGVASLLRVWGDSARAKRSSSEGGEPGPRRKRANTDTTRTAIGSAALIVTMVLVLGLVFLSGLPASPASLELVGLAALGVVFAVVLLLRSKT